MMNMANMEVGFLSAVWMIFMVISSTDVEAAKSVSLQILGVKTESSCQSGLIHGQDNFTVRGRVNTENITSSDVQRLQFIILGTNIEITPCTVGLSSCHEQNTSFTPTSCYCVDIGNEDYDVFFTRSASVLYSNATIKLDYRDEDIGYFTISSSDWKIPLTFYKDKEELTLESNGIKVDLTSSQCTLPFREGENTFKYCCSNAPSCNVKITQPDGREFGSIGCYELTASGISESLPYVFSHSVCGVESSQTYSCTGRLAPELFPTEKPSPVDSDDDEDTLHPGVIAAIVIAVVAVLVIGIVISVLLIRKKRLGDTNIAL